MRLILRTFVRTIRVRHIHPMKRTFTCLLVGVLVGCASNSGVFRV